MTDRDDGGPAFPVSCEVRVGEDEEGPIYGTGLACGMSLRDYFAAKAMQGLLTERLPDHHGEGGDEVIASDAYIIANAMLNEREK